MFFITHPDHGAMHVYSQSDLATHQARGWTIGCHADLMAAKLRPQTVEVQVTADAPDHTITSVRAHLDSLGIPYDNRLGLGKLLALLPAV